MNTDADRAQKHGMDEFISANPCNFDHGSLFELVQRLTLDHRLNDSYSCLVRKDFQSVLLSETLLHSWVKNGIKEGFLREKVKSLQPLGVLDNLTKI